ncbi:hypothetical protein ACFX14_003533 [Malus domestica]
MAGGWGRRGKREREGGRERERERGRWVRGWGWDVGLRFIPTSAQGNASHTNSLSISIAFRTILSTQPRFALRKTRSRHPSQGPLGLLRDAGDGVDCVEEAMLLVGVFDVHLGVDVLNGDLEPVEGTSLGDLDLLHKPPNTILKDDVVGGSEEGENV